MIEYKEKGQDSREYSISKKENNTHYHVQVTDSYGQESGAFFRTIDKCNEYIYNKWENEVKPSKDMESLTNAVWGCIKLDEELGLIRNNRDNLD